jgi:hypothetical protein
MKLIQGRSVTVLVSAAVLLIGAGGVLAPPPQLAAARSVHSKMDRLRVSITTTSGTVWGNVTASYSYRHKSIKRSCTATKCQLQIPNGAKMHLTQVPTDATTWPFKAWQIRSSKGTRTLTTRSIKVKMTGTLAITAVYVLSSSQQQAPPNPGYHP